MKFNPVWLDSDRLLFYRCFTRVVAEEIHVVARAATLSQRFGGRVACYYPVAAGLLRAGDEFDTAFKSIAAELGFRYETEREIYERSGQLIR